MIDLPNGWEYTEGQIVYEIVRGVSYKKQDVQTSPEVGLIPVLRANNIQDGRIIADELVYVPSSYVSEDQYLKAGDILIATSSGSRHIVGKTAIAGENDSQFAFGAFCAVARPRYESGGKWIYHFSRSRAYRHYVEEVALGININNFRTSDLATLLLPIAPLPEQCRIVAKLDALFARTRQAQEELENIPSLIEHYKQAILAAAFRGELTADCREETEYEPASVLLERILKARYEKWEANLVAQGKNPRHSKYVEPPEPDFTNLPKLELPEDWVLTSIGQVAECLDRMRVPVNKTEREKRQGDVPYYGANGQVGWIDDYLFDESLVLVVEDETFIGREKPFSYKITGKAWVNNHAHVLRPTDGVDVDFLNYSLMYYPFIPLTSGTTGRRKLSQISLLSAPYALPPYDEQIRIVERLSEAFEWLDAVLDEIVSALRLLDHLDQANLAKAFRGELVPQDPNDEPSSILLERIREARAEQSNGSREKSVNREEGQKL